MSRFNGNNFVFTCLIFWPVTVFRATDGGSITWFESPLSETVTNPATIFATYKSVFKGSLNKELSCNFSLSSDLSLLMVVMKFNSSSVVTFLPNQQAPSVTSGFVSRFNATWVPNKLTLILLNVTDAEEGEYRCEVTSFSPGQTWIRTIHVSLLVSSSITKITGNIVREGENVTLNCSHSGKPTPRIKWTRLSDNRTVTMPLIKISRHDPKDYRCTADNDVGTPATRDITIDVQYEPDTVSLVANATENTNCCDLLWLLLTCEASDANPPVESYQLLKEGEIVATSSYGTWITGISEGKDHVYSCKALHLFGNVTADSVIVTFNVPAQISVFASGSEVLIEGGNVSLYCNASAYPDPIVTWSKLNANGFTELGSWLNFTSIGRDEAGDYICIANNTCGKRNSSRRTIDVQYRPEGNGSGQNATVAGGFEHTFSCPVDGNPVPNITWYNEIGAIYSGKQFKTSQSGCYICVARNIRGISGNITQCLIINSSLPTVPPTTDSSQTMVSSITVPPRQEIRAILTILTIYEPAFKDLNSSSSKEFVAKFEQQMDKIYWNMPEYIRTEVTKLRPGNVIVYFILYFKTALTPEEGIENLRIAISSNGTFGDFQAKDLHLISEQSTKPTTPKGSSSASTTVPKAGPPWIIIIAVAGGVVLLAILVGVSTWWVHKQRKCRKGTKVHNSGLGRHDDEEGYSQVQGAYAHSGPPAANGADGAAEQEIGAARAIPTYAVVDKSKKSKEQADEKPPEYAVVDKTQKKEKQEVAAISTYAAVDKSKKKKKSREEVPAVYAEVDKSKKKKKKKVDDKNLYEDLDEPKKEKKPGELLYADLGDFQNPSMPTVSTSPQPLPAIKKADPYERTDYADITQFLKGNATLPPNDGNGDTEMKPKRPSKNTIQGNDKETPI